MTSTWTWTMTTMKRRKRTRGVTLATTALILFTTAPISKAFTSISIQQSHDRSCWGSNGNHRHHRLQQRPPPSTITPSSTPTRRYFTQNSNGNGNRNSNSCRPNQTADVENETTTGTGKQSFTASTSTNGASSSVSLDDSKSNSSNSSDPPQKQQPPPQKKIQLPEPTTLLSKNDNDIDNKSGSSESNNESIQTNENEVMIDNEFQNEIDQDDAQIQELKQCMRDFLREPVVEVVDCSLVLLSSLLVAISTLPDLAVGLQAPIQYAENTIGSVFAVEFLVRWYSQAGKGLLSGSSTSHKKGLMYFAQPSVLVDIVAVILPLLFATQPSSFWADSTFVPNWLTSSSGLINLRLLRILRLQRVLQDMDTFTKFEVALGISDSNVKAWQLQLARTVLSIFTLLSVSTGLIYTAEHDVNPNIPDYFTALYFGLTTLTTVGFGDIVPVSWEGRLVVSGSILAGVAVIPAQAAVLVEALLARQEERQAAIQLQVQESSSQTTVSASAATATATATDNAATNTSEDDDNGEELDADTSTISTSVSDPIRQEVAAQAAKRRHTLVHGSNINMDNDDQNDNDNADNIVTPSRMVLETEFACPSCGVSMHWSSAKFCWSCGERMV